MLSLWLSESPLTPDKAYCKFCEKDFSPKKDVLLGHARENSIHKVRVAAYLRIDNREIEIENCPELSTIKESSASVPRPEVIENSPELSTIKESSASVPSPEVMEKECQENECIGVPSTKVVEKKCYNALSTEVTEKER